MKYYHIIGRNLVAKVDEHYCAYIYQNGEWVIDTKNMVFDSLYGFDPDDVPLYGFGNIEISDDIESITEEEAMELIAQQENSKKN